MMGQGNEERQERNESAMLQIERGTFVWRQEPVPAWGYAAHTLTGRGHISPANIKVCRASMKRRRFPRSTADPLITPDEVLCD